MNDEGLCIESVVVSSTALAREGKRAGVREACRKKTLRFGMTTCRSSPSECIRTSVSGH